MRQIIQSLAIENAQFALAHTALAATFMLPSTTVLSVMAQWKKLKDVSNSAIYFLNPKCGFYVLEKAQSTLVRCWNLRNGVCCAVGASSNSPCFPIPIPKCDLYLYAIGNCVPKLQKIVLDGAYF